MTPKRRDRKSVARSGSAGYSEVAESFRGGAEAAREFEYWNAAGVLAGHAAIAYADAVRIKVGGVKSSGEDHMGAVDLLREVVAIDEDGHRALKHLARMIEEKNLVSYSGEIYARKDVDELLKHLERFRTWALRMLGR